MNKLTALLVVVIALSWVNAQSDVDAEWENYKVSNLNRVSQKKRKKIIFEKCCW